MDKLSIESATLNAVRHGFCLHDTWDHVFGQLNVKHGTQEYDEAKEECEKLAKSYGVYD